MFNKFDKVIDSSGEVFCVLNEYVCVINGLKVRSINRYGNIRDINAPSLSLLTPKLQEDIRKARQIAWETEEQMSLMVYGG